jgi:hypothetical protein
MPKSPMYYDISINDLVKKLVNSELQVFWHYQICENHAFENQPTK